MTAVDTHDFTGAGVGKQSTVQALLDKITQKLIEKVVTSDTFQQVLAKYLVNNGLTTEAGKFGLDAAFGKNLQDQITEQNSNINSLTSAQNSKVDKSQLSGNGTTINTICLYKNTNDGKLYLQVNWNDGIAYIQADQTSGL